MGHPGSSNAAAAGYADVTPVHTLLAECGNRLEDQQCRGIEQSGCARWLHKPEAVGSNPTPAT